MDWPVSQIIQQSINPINHSEDKDEHGDEIENLRWQRIEKMKRRRSGLGRC